MKIHIIEEGIEYDPFSKESILAAAIIKKAQSKDPSGHKLAGYAVGVEPHAYDNPVFYGSGNGIMLARDLYPSENPAYDRLSCIISGQHQCGKGGTLLEMLDEKSSNSAFLDYCVMAALDYLNDSPSDTLMFELDDNGTLDRTTGAPLRHRAVDQSAYALDYVNGNPNWRNIYHYDFSREVLPDLMKIFPNNFIDDDGYMVLKVVGVVTKLDVWLYNHLRIAMSPMIIVS